MPPWMHSSPGCAVPSNACVVLIARLSQNDSGSSARAPRCVCEFSCAGARGIHRQALSQPLRLTRLVVCLHRLRSVAFSSCSSDTFSRWTRSVRGTAERSSSLRRDFSVMFATCTTDHVLAYASDTLFMGLWCIDVCLARKRERCLPGLSA